MFFDVEYFRYFLMRFLFKDIQVEHRAASVGKFRYKFHQHLFGKIATGFGKIGIVRHVRKMFFIHHQLDEALLPPKVIYGLCHHHPCHPRAQCTLSAKREVGENLYETIVQYVMGRIDVARVTVAHRQHLLGVEGV